jgi:geranylgeranyl diphosphate synthase, type I
MTHSTQTSGTFSNRRNADLSGDHGVDTLRHEIDAEMQAQFEQLVQRGPMAHDPLVRQIYRWTQHYLESGGRRMHGVCVWLTYVAFGGKDEDAIRKVAAAIQLYHHHTMVHDDVYDEDTARRRWPTTHVAFADWFAARRCGSDTDTTRLFHSDAARRGAVSAFAYGKIVRALALYGIGTAGFDHERTLAVSNLLNWHDLFDNAGQMKDVDFENRQIPSSQTCLSNAWLKTGRLFEICARIGAILAGADERQQDAAARWAGNAGLAYQIQDDLEDIADASEKGQGRGIGVDLLYCKPTYLYALTRELASPSDRQALQEWERSERTEQGIPAIIDIVRRSGAHEQVEREVKGLLADGQAALHSVADGMRPGFEDTMLAFAHYFVSPEYWNRPLEDGEPTLGTLFSPDRPSSDAPSYPDDHRDSRKHGCGPHRA